ncbi:MAG: CoA transferase subunit A, partial [Deltaproteobacteria bacterium]|nr:CoA transferase subunit A [Deltaproteobacteria bacterium]
DSDEEHMFYMNKAMKTAEDTEEYCRKWVHSYETPEQYLELIGQDKIAKVSATETAFLMDPYRKWILSDTRVAELLDQAKG